ncbi:MAG: D-glycerate dehydrogenase [Gemmatimonadales bacterium]|nr:D-glycerate dehydrogenase [Gemmatimonadales bacterium]MDZ4389082.1 D-glycerate dehydrogenase [Gemmatimonadales bacterium]
MTARPRVAVTRRLPEAVEAALAERFDVTLATLDRPTTPETLQRALGEADGVLCTLTDRITAEVLAANPLRTRILAQFGVGVDNIDLAAAAAHDIVVTNTPGVLTDDTADLAMLLILAVMRRSSGGERLVRVGGWTGWTPTNHLGRQVSGATLGVIGFGRIGQAVARRAHHGFGMRVLAWGRTPPPEAWLASMGVEYVASLDAVMARSDVVSLHLPSTSETRGIINAERLALMKPGAFLVNTARGDIVDDDALIAAIRDGRLAGAGLDVYRGEPVVDPRLLALDQVTLLPHLGSATVETREAMGFRALANLEAFFAGKPVPDLVR